jgi:hypothetical protein
MSAQHNTNLYHLCLLTTYKLVYYGREILRIRSLPHTNLYMAVKYYEFVCFQLYEFNTTNLYMTNQERKNIQICMKQRLHTERKNSCIKKGTPP